MYRRSTAVWSGALASLALVACASGRDEPELAVAAKASTAFGLGYNAHLTNRLLFEPIQPGTDPDRGRALFGVAADLETADAGEALFEGESYAAGREVISNGRTCFACHRGTPFNFGLPPPPLTDSIPADDVLFTEVQADGQGDPDAEHNLIEHGLIKHRPNRFNQARSEDDPFRQVFFWRKSPPLVNVAFNHGFLMDGRGRVIREADAGAVFSHTQPDDVPFGDLFTAQDARDMTAFQFSLVSDPALLALRDPSDPDYHMLEQFPFATVPVSTSAQWRGEMVFKQYCMVCHDMPQVFNNRASVDVVGTDGLSPEQPAFAPHVGRSFNIGVAERNRHGLRFTRRVSPGVFEPIVLELANEDGTINRHTITFDIGLAATTGRSVDIGRFKVPQLRNIRKLGPYFHDNSADTLDEVVDYFNSDYYNDSADGSRFPIHMTSEERDDLLEFLYIL